MTWNTLTPEEEHIIEDKGTERPFTGEYVSTAMDGVYHCRRCDAPLYTSDSKFDSHCGWPSFDNAIPGKVGMSLDEDGRRTEITCATCDGHLGHIFVGEKETETNARHCVNSLSMQFKAGETYSAAYETATFGGGCFWCIESTVKLLKGVIEVRSGYSGGEIEYPTYEEVCRGNTEHIEVVQVFFDPKMISYKQLLEIFFTQHDPTTVARQGHDKGEQYSSVIFYHDEAQHKIAEQLITSLDTQGIWSSPIVTQVRPLEKFWIAEGYHQNYSDNNSWNPYCTTVIAPKIVALRAKWSHLIKEE